MWDTQNGKVLKYGNTPCTTRVDAVCMSLDCRLAMCGDQHGAILLWEIEKEDRAEVLHRDVGHSSAVKALDMSPDKKFAFAGFYDGRIEVWNLELKKKIRSLSGHTGGVMGLSFCEDTSYVVSVSEDKTLIIWNLDSGKPEARLFSKNTIWSMSMAGKRVAFSDSSGVINFIDIIF